MSTTVSIKVPNIEESGFWVLKNFLNCFKHSDGHIWINIEIGYVDLIGDEKNRKYTYIYNKIIPYPLQYIMYLSVDNEYDLSGKPIKRKKFTFQSSNWDIHTEPQKLVAKVYDHNDFDKFGNRFPFSNSSNGMVYYDLFDFKKDGEENTEIKDKSKIKIILPASIIGQFFYFLETDFNNLLYNNQLRHILKDYNPTNIAKEKGEKIGRIFYEWEQCKNYNTINAIANFLFSKDENLSKVLYDVFKKNTDHLKISSENIPFNYRIPILSRLKLKVRGNYFRSDKADVFVVSEILDFETKDFDIKNLFTVDKIEYQPDIDFYPSGERKPNDAENGRPGLRGSSGNNSTEISGSSPANPNFKPRNITQKSKNRFGNIIPIEKSIDEERTTRVTTDRILINPETHDGDTLHPENGVKDDNKRGIKTNTGIFEVKEPKDEEKTKTYLREVIKFFTKKYNAAYEIISIPIEDFPEVDIIEINPKDTEEYIYFVDAFRQRIQVIHNIQLKQYTTNTFKEVLESVTRNAFNSWQPWRNSNYVFEGMEFDISINRGVDNYVDDEFYKKETDKFLNRIQSITKK